MSRVFGHGDLRLYLLAVLGEGPRHGYEIIRLLEDRFLGLYTPSAGTIYPRLAALEADGLVTHETVEGRKVFSLTPAGSVELEVRAEEVNALEDRVAQSATDVAREVRSRVRSSVRDLRAELKTAVADVRREERRYRNDWHAVKHELRGLKTDLRAFVSDVLRAAAHEKLTDRKIEAIRSTLIDARASIRAALDR